MVCVWVSVCVWVGVCGGRFIYIYIPKCEMDVSERRIFVTTRGKSGETLMRSASEGPSAMSELSSALIIIGQ